MPVGTGGQKDEDGLCFSSSILLPWTFDLIFRQAWLECFMFCYVELAMLVDISWLSWLNLVSRLGNTFKLVRLTFRLG